MCILFYILNGQRVSAAAGITKQVSLIITIEKQCVCVCVCLCVCVYRGADKSLARHTSRCILSDGENISFDASLVIYINSTNVPPIVIINKIYEHQNLLSL